MGIYNVDMHAVATAVAQSVRTLNNTAASAQAHARDDIMAKEMQPAMKEVDDACNLLLQSTEGMKSDPRNGHLRKRMVEAANGTTDRRLTHKCSRTHSL